MLSTWDYESWHFGWKIETRWVVHHSQIRGILHPSWDSDCMDDHHPRSDILICSCLWMLPGPSYPWLQHPLPHPPPHHSAYWSSPPGPCCLLPGSYPVWFCSSWTWRLAWLSLRTLLLSLDIDQHQPLTRRIRKHFPVQIVQKIIIYNFTDFKNSTKNIFLRYLHYLEEDSIGILGRQFIKERSYSLAGSTPGGCEVNDHQFRSSSSEFRLEVRIILHVLHCGHALCW